MQCLELYTDKRESEDERVHKILKDLKEFEENGLSNYLEQLHPALVPLDPSQQDFLQSFALQQLSQQSPMAENRFFNRSNSDDSPTIDQREVMHSFLRQQEMLRQGGHNGNPAGEPGGSSTSLQGKEDDMERPPPHPHGFPPHPLPMSNVPMMMQRPPLMMMPFFPFGGFPMPPIPMMPPQMIPPNMMDPQSPHPSTPQPPVDQESDEREQSTVSVESKPKQDDGIEFSHQESRKAESNSLPLGTHLVAPAAFTVPSSAYEQPSAVVSSEVKPKAQADVGALQTSRASGPSSNTKTQSDKQSNSPPRTPFEAKNPYDAVVVDKPPATDSKSKDAASPEGNSSSVQVDESQNLPNRKGKQSNQQQRPPQRQRPARQPTGRYHTSQYSSKQTSQEHQTGAAKSGRNEGRPRKESPTSKEPADGTDNESSRATPRSGFKTGNRFSSYSKPKGAPGNRSGGNQSRQQRQQSGPSSAGGIPNQSSTSRSFYSRRGRQQESSTQASSGGGQGKRQESSTQVSGRSGGHSGQDSTRSTLHLEHSERQNFPCTVFQPRAFRGGFPSPSHPVSSLDGDYACPQPAMSPRWKFTSNEEETNNPPLKLSRNLLNWDSKDPWPDWNTEKNPRAEASQTVEDPFPTFPSSQHQWDSDAGDLNVSLTVDPLTNLDGGGYRFPPPATVSTARVSAYSAVNTHAQCVRESKVSSKVDSECVVGN